MLELNVGGECFATSRAVLCSQGGMLSTMFAPDSPFGSLTVDDDGRVFIDRDPGLFGFVLAFLRSGDLASPPTKPVQVVDGFAESRRVVNDVSIDPAALRGLAAEADYFQLSGLSEVVRELLLTFSAKDLYKAGFSVERLQKLDFSAYDVYKAGARPAQLWSHCVEYRAGANVPTNTLVIALGGLAGHHGKFGITSQHHGRVKLVTHLDRGDGIPTHAPADFPGGVRLVRFQGDAYKSTDPTGKMC